MNRNPPHILFVVHDAGGACALTPVLSAMVEGENTFRISVYADGPARNILRKANDAADDQITKFPDFNTIDVLVTGTGLGNIPEKTALALARQYKAPSIAFIDYWSNYTERFSRAGTDDWSCLSDTVCVIDERMADELGQAMHTRGIVEQPRIVVTGNPYFDTLEQIVPVRGSYLLYVSQPYSELPDFAKVGYEFDEVEILREYVRVLEQIGVETPIVISPHPRERQLEKFDAIIAHHPRVSLALKSTDELIRGALLVAGIDSMVLLTSAISGADVVSFQPGIQKKDDRLQSNRIGISKCAYTSAELAEILYEILVTGKKVSAPDHADVKCWVDRGATQRVVSTIKGIIAQHRSYGV